MEPFETGLVENDLPEESKESPALFLSRAARPYRRSWLPLAPEPWTKPSSRPQARDSLSISSSRYELSATPELSVGTSSDIHSDWTEVLEPCVNVDLRDARNTALLAGIQSPVAPSRYPSISLVMPQADGGPHNLINLDAISARPTHGKNLLNFAPYSWDRDLEKDHGVEYQYDVAAFGSKTGQPPARSKARDFGRRSDEETASIKELSNRQLDLRRYEEIRRWLQRSNRPQMNPELSLSPPSDLSDHSSLKDIPMGCLTENKTLPDQIYYTETGGPLMKEDISLMLEHRAWVDAPMISRITMEGEGSPKPQPISSSAAMERFAAMCPDDSSVISRAATWGTRRRSLSDLAEVEKEGTSKGSFLKRVSVHLNKQRSTHMFRNILGLPRRPDASQKLKRRNHGFFEDPAQSSSGARTNDDSILPKAQLKASDRWPCRSQTMPNFSSTKNAPLNDTSIRREKPPDWVLFPRSGDEQAELEPATTSEINDEKEADKNQGEDPHTKTEDLSSASQFSRRADGQPFRRASQIRQVGLAKLHIEIVALRHHAIPGHGENDQSSSSSSEDEGDGDDYNENGGFGVAACAGQPDPGEGNDTSEPERAVQSTVSPTPGRQRAIFDSRSEEQRDGDEEGENSGGKKTRPMDRTKLPRLSCPYQAYEPWHECLKQGPRNPQGGCAGVYRLK